MGFDRISALQETTKPAQLGQGYQPKLDRLHDAGEVSDYEAVRRKEAIALREVIQNRCPNHLPELDLALNTGLRLSEQYELTWECVDFSRRSLTVARSKNGEIRHIPLNDAAVAALTATSTAAIGHGLVFLNYLGQPLRSPREWFERRLKEAGIQDSLGIACDTHSPADS